MTPEQMLAAIRDEIGDTTPPADVDLTADLTELGDWRLVALRVLKRRRAALVGGGGSIQSVNLPGVVSVGFGAGDLRYLDGQIARLQAAYDAEQVPPVEDTSASHRARRIGARG